MDELSADAGVTPDTKDWTWTLERACPECGFDARQVDGGEVADAVLAHTAAWPAVLDRVDVTVRPRPGTWSGLEYACHVRDVCRVFRGRLLLMLAEQDPFFEDWDQDAAAVQGRYAAQSPSHVDLELREAARALAEAFAGVPPEAWSRRGTRSNGSQFTVLTLGRYLLHDLAHHLVDVGAPDAPPPPAGSGRGAPSAG